MKRILIFVLLISILTVGVINNGVFSAEEPNEKPFLFYPPSNNAYPVISFTNATAMPSKNSAYLTVKATSTEKGTFSSLAITVYGKDMKAVATGNDPAVYRNKKSVSFWYSIYSELGVFLNSATEYFYQYTVNFNGKTYYSPIYSFTTEGVFERRFGIDVSYHQGEIDWETVSQYIDYAIIRCGYGADDTANDDTMWERNVSECERLKIPYGVYIYSYATNEIEAESEACHAIRLLLEHNPSLPVYYDLEDADTVGLLTDDQIATQASVFCEMLKKYGYTPGVYASDNWWKNRLSSDIYNQYEKWMAAYNGSYANTAKSYRYWQYTSSGQMPGISGRIDLNYSFIGYGNHMHNYLPTVTEEPTCTDEGTAIYSCSCGRFYTDTVQKLGHDFSIIVSSTEGTGNENPHTVYKCSRCEETYSS